MRKSRQERMKYSQGSLVTTKTIGELDLSLSGSVEGSSKRNFSTAGINVSGRKLDAGIQQSTYRDSEFKFKDKSKSYGIGYTSDKGTRIGLSQDVSGKGPYKQKRTTLSISKLLK